jgi:hypothetical protein
MQQEDTLQTGSETVAEREAVDRAFGAENRNKLIDQYFAQTAPHGVSAQDAWSHVYRLLLWSDPTTGLAHCYESDKSQPGKPWYARSLAFHDWICSQLNCEPNNLGHELDWLFIRACSDLSDTTLRREAQLAKAATKQRAQYAGREFPVPGADPELAAIIQEALSPYLVSNPPEEQWLAITQKLRQFLAVQNKRKNLVGEGFEDVLAQIVRRACGGSEGSVLTRKSLYDIPGFNRARHGMKENKVDLAIVRPTMRTIVTAKWSVRADREKQFVTEYDEYINAEAEGKKFHYVFVTNEFDPARLMRACDNLHRNSPMFDSVVHINTDAVRATYGNVVKGGGAKVASWERVLDHIENGRLISLGDWLSQLATQ